jgi:lipoprotein-releasing system permease protein
MMMVIFGMIGIITVFIVFVVFYMIVSHKSRDIGILKSVGASNTNVLSLFLFFASLIGVIGATIGAVGGWQFLEHINQIEDWLFRRFGFQLWDRTIYAIGDIPNKIELRVLVPIVLSAITACLIGAFIPSRQAAKCEPVQTLQVAQL